MSKPLLEPVVLLGYASPPRRQPSARMVAVFTALSVIAVLTSGSVAWALLMGHR